MRGELIPVILAKDAADFKKGLATLKSLKPSPRWIQIDVVDGQFAPYKTLFSNPRDVGKLARLKFLRSKNLGGVEVDLMVVDPLRHARVWIKAGAKRILFHVEPNVKDAPRTVIAYAKAQGAEVGLSLNARTPLRRLLPYIDEVDCVLLLGVNPGRSGQPFQRQVLKKIRTLRKKFPTLPIEVDGGVSLSNAGDILRAGATRLAAASAIHKAADPQKAYHQFLKVVSKFK